MNNDFFNKKSSNPANSAALEPQRENQKEHMIRVDGRGQVLDMLRAADPAFRETILRRLEKRDPQLVRELRAALQRG